MAAAAPALGCLASLSQCFNNVVPCFGKEGSRWQCTCQNVGNYARCCLACACCSSDTHVEGDRIGGDHVVTDHPTLDAAQIDLVAKQSINQGAEPPKGLDRAIHAIQQDDV